MSYYAHGRGYISIKQMPNEHMIHKLEQAFDKVTLPNEKDVFQFINVVYYYGPYEEESVVSALKEIESITTSGSIRFYGEDDIPLEFFFDRKDKTWKEENAYVLSHEEKEHYFEHALDYAKVIILTDSECITEDDKPYIVATCIVDLDVDETLFERDFKDLRENLADMEDFDGDESVLIGLKHKYGAKLRYWTTNCTVLEV